VVLQLPTKLQYSKTDWYGISTVKLVFTGTGSSVFFSACGCLETRLTPTSPVVRRHFHPIAAHLHAAPIPRVIFGRIVKIENARRIATLLDQCKVCSA
jgi:hypothetical protein